MQKTTSLQRGKGLYATFLNLNTPDKSIFQSYIDGGLARMSVFVFVPSGSSLPTTAQWYTTVEGGQPQGLDTYGGSTVEEWQQLFHDLGQVGIEIGFVFGGEGGTAQLGPMLQGLNGSEADFAAFVTTLRSYNVSYIEFDIEGTWETPPGFAAEFEAFAESLKQHSEGAISIFVGASAPVGTVDGASSNIPSFLDNDFATANNVYFNVYTYYTTEVSNVLANPSPWIPTDTTIDPGRIVFAVTANAETPGPSGQITFVDFMAGLPSSHFQQTIAANYLGAFVWVWWHGEHLYPEANVRKLFQAIPSG